MKRFFPSLLLTALLSLIACFYLPWWSIALVAFLVSAFIPQRPLVAFATGFLALFLLWFGFTFMISSANEHLLARKMAVVILKTDNAFALMLVSALVAGLVAGFAALSGSFVRKRPVRTQPVLS